MKNRMLVIPLALFAAINLSLVPAWPQTVVTFDDINLASEQPYGPIPSNYHGLAWSSYFSCLNAVQFTSNGQYPSGYYYGMVSASNVAYNGSAFPVEIDSSTNFNFLSTYLTGAWNSNLNIEVQGYRDSNLIYDETVVASAANPTLFTFNYLNIDRLTLNSFGGQGAGFGFEGGNFAMDNFTFEFVPEPSTIVLTGVGAVFLFAFRKRKRA